jgi:large repetitive protein
LTATAANRLGNWSVTLGALANATYTYTATATHAAGNASPLSSPYVFTMETTAPGAQTLSDASVVGDCVDAANDTAAQTLGGTAVAGDTVKVYLNGSTTPAFTTIADAV